MPSSDAPAPWTASTISGPASGFAQTALELGHLLVKQVGAGLGLKWRSPLGPIRFYLGYPVTANDKNVRFHLRLGADL